MKTNSEILGFRFLFISCVFSKSDLVNQISFSNWKWFKKKNLGADCVFFGIYKLKKKKINLKKNKIKKIFFWNV